MDDTHAQAPKVKVNSQGGENKDGGAEPPKLLLNDFLTRFHIETETGESEMTKDLSKPPQQLSLVHPQESEQDKKKCIAEKLEQSDLLEKLPDEIIRPELNIEKHADFIFIPAHSKKVQEPRKREGWLTLPDGTREKSYLQISPIVGGSTPTTTTRRIYLALQFLYEQKKREDKIRPDGSMITSSREVMRAALLMVSGSTMRVINDEIETLRSCMFEWAHVFVAPNGEKYDILSTVNIIDKYERVSKKRRKTPEEQYQAAHVVRFGEHIRNNLDANKTKPVNYSAILTIQGEIALVLYTRLDIILADKENYARTSRGLFEDLNLDDEKEYRYPSARKRRLEKAIKELDGKCISTGILKLRLERTADGLDWKLVAHKIPVIPFNVRTNHVRVFANTSEMVELLGRDIGDVIGEYDNKHRLYETFAVHYPAEFIYQAIAEFKTEGHHAEHRVKFFTVVMHRIAHQRGREWIKPCPDSCKFRPKKW